MHVYNIVQRAILKLHSRVPSYWSR